MMVIASLGAALGGIAFGALSPALLIRGYAALVFVAVLYAAFPSWNAFIYALMLDLAILFSATGLKGEWALLSYELEPSQLPFIAGVALAAVIGPCVQVVAQWDKALILRLGRFHKVKGPGMFLLAPLVDRCAAVVDTRIRVTDFSAERILTRDTVPIHVDALAFWMIWDTQKAILEVEDFLEAVTLSAQTALRDSVGKYSLSTLLSERETLYREIQSILDAKTNPWGITILSVEFVDIQLPKDLEDVMSRQAQAEREKKARLFLAEAELEVAGKFVEASELYKGNPEALNLRGMNMVYDAIKARGSMVLLPSNALQSMNIGSVLGTASMAKATGGQEAAPAHEEA
ncbi:MAG TPA: membrane protease subunit, stomatin/prohibitin [Spirochaetaceae bacterium]|jgi:regulator of protease activity HflC (stomatin/prohibitin superfamily)|nr:membrane protease subunit, stomatin/prohibitin [Spirochaetaceae bacterium]